jgi:hypothetical protein
MGAAGNKKRENHLRWLGYWLAALLPTLKNQAQIGVFCVTARFTQWCIPDNRSTPLQSITNKRSWFGLVWWAFI